MGQEYSVAHPVCVQAICRQAAPERYGGGKLAAQQ